MFRIIAFLRLGYFWLNLKFTPKYTIVGGEDWVFNIFIFSKPIILVTQELKQSL